MPSKVRLSYRDANVENPGSWAGYTSGAPGKGACLRLKSLAAPKPGAVISIFSPNRLQPKVCKRFATSDRKRLLFWYLGGWEPREQGFKWSRVEMDPDGFWVDTHRKCYVSHSQIWDHDSSSVQVDEQKRAKLLVGHRPQDLPSTTCIKKHAPFKSGKMMFWMLAKSKSWELHFTQLLQDVARHLAHPRVYHVVHLLLSTQNVVFEQFKCTI